MEIKKLETEFFTEPTNFAVVRMPGREFPGVVFQGDSLFIMSERLDELYDTARKLGDEDLDFSITEIRDQIKGILSNYESVLASFGIELPYKKS